MNSARHAPGFFHLQKAVRAYDFLSVTETSCTGIDRKALLNVRNDRRNPPRVLIDNDKVFPGYQILTTCIPVQHLYSFGEQASQVGLSRH